MLQPETMPELGVDRVGEIGRAPCSRVGLSSVLGPGPSEEDGRALADRVARAFDCPDEYRGRPDARLAIRRCHSGSRAALRRAARAVGRAGPARASRVLSGATPGDRASAWGRMSAARHDGLRQRARGRVRAARRRGRHRVLRRCRPEPREVPAPRRPTAWRRSSRCRTRYTELSLAARPVILKVHGSFDRPPGARRRELRRQRGRLHRLSGSERARERRPGDRSRRSSAAAICSSSRYPVVEWSLRVFLHRVFGDEPISYRSWAVLPGAQPIQQRVLAAAGRGSLRRRRSKTSSASSERRLGGGADMIPKGRTRACPVRGHRARRPPLLRPRARERVIAANVLASRLTVLYGPSGVGKSVVAARRRSASPASTGEGERRRARPSRSSSSSSSTSWSDDPVGAFARRFATRWPSSSAPRSSTRARASLSRTRSAAGRTRSPATCCSCSTRPRSTSSTTQRRPASRASCPTS